MQLELIVFYAFAAVSVLAALAVIFFRRAVYGALSLIVCFAAMAALYIQMEAGFLGAVQMIVYAGAIMVLFLFVIMLLDPEAESVFKSRKYGALLVVVVPSIAVLGYALIRDLVAGPASVGNLGEAGSVAAVGRSLFSDYLLPFELTGILILVAVIGAIVLAKSHD